MLFKSRQSVIVTLKRHLCQGGKFWRSPHKYILAAIYSTGKMSGVKKGDKF